VSTERKIYVILTTASPLFEVSQAKKRCREGRITKKVIVFDEWGIIGILEA